MKTGDSKFVFKGYSADIKKGRAQFFYSIVRGGAAIDFIETLAFPPPKPHTQIPGVLLDRICRNIMLMLGISYWKTYCPRIIEIRDNWLTKKEAGFWNIVYTKGLGEFFYKNNIDFRGLVQFPYASQEKPHSILFPREKRSLLLFGGGKDSIVSGELLQRSRKPFAAFSINTHPLQKEGAALLGAEHIGMKRTMDAQLFALNTKKGIYNGHIPASAIYAFLGLLSALLYDFGYIVASHEKSANYGNIMYHGEEINHQWSKSKEFETLFRNYMRSFLTRSMTYYSLLRPLSELEIVKRFSAYKKYFPVFSSCNSNFRINGKQKRRWCGACPKCAFVFLALAAYIPKKEIMRVFGKNLLADTALIPVYEELLGLKRFKPFECVGTPKEAQSALSLVYQRGEFSGDHIMKFFLGKI